MQSDEVVLFEGDTEFEHYQVIDMVYVGRSARVLFSGYRSAAQSGVPKDGNHAMLFDYNQRFLELIQSLQPKNILLIGGGTFTLPIEVHRYFPKVKFDVVERDPKLLELAKQFFSLKPNQNLRVFFKDGREFLEDTIKTYDLILLDAFVHNIIPIPLSTQEFAQLISRRLSKKGVVATNIISAYQGPNNGVIKQQYATYKSVFKHVDIFPADKTLSLWISQNFILASSNRRLRPIYNLRFGSLHSPIINSENILHDQ
jgi:spermidine synthase